jgi:hypothetical protein
VGYNALPLRSYRLPRCSAAPAASSATPVATLDRSRATMAACTSFGWLSGLKPPSSSSSSFLAAAAAASRL